VALQREDLAAAPEYATNAQRVALRDELDPVIADWTRTQTLSALQVQLDTANIGYARLNGVQDLIDHPQLAERGRWTKIDSPVGPLDALLPPPISASWPMAPGAVPGLGQHTDDVLTRLGIDAARIGQLREEGVV
jgi:itaconate CoA-transferase